MLIGVLLILSLISVPLLGGRLSALADVQLRLVPLVVGALAIQILIVNVIPGGSHDLHAAVLIATYLVIGVTLAANIRMPGVPLIAAGGLANFLAIVTNDGVMPASEAALRTAGLPADPNGYTNSGLVENANLAFLGDIFAMPASWPAANVFSIGDLLLALGAFVLLHAVCGSRLGRRRGGPGAHGPDSLLSASRAAIPSARRRGRRAGSRAATAPPSCRPRRRASRPSPTARAPAGRRAA